MRYIKISHPNHSYSLINHLGDKDIKVVIEKLKLENPTAIVKEYKF